MNDTVGKFLLGFFAVLSTMGLGILLLLATIFAQAIGRGYTEKKGWDEHSIRDAVIGWVIILAYVSGAVLIFYVVGDFLYKL